MLSCSVVSNSVQPHGLYLARLLCPWGFSRQDYWSGLPCTPPGHLPNLGNQYEDTEEASGGGKQGEGEARLGWLIQQPGSGVNSSYRDSAGGAVRLNLGNKIDPESLQVYLLRK